MTTMTFNDEMTAMLFNAVFPTFANHFSLPVFQHKNFY